MKTIFVRIWIIKFELGKISCNLLKQLLQV